MGSIMFFGILTLFVTGMCAFLWVLSQSNAMRDSSETAGGNLPDHEAADIAKFFSRGASTAARDQDSNAGDLMVERLERYLRLESARVEEFVSEPSIGRLYRESERVSQLN